MSGTAPLQGSAASARAAGATGALLRSGSRGARRDADRGVRVLEIDGVLGGVLGVAVADALEDGHRHTADDRTDRDREQEQQEVADREEHEDPAVRRAQLDPAA